MCSDQAFPVVISIFFVANGKSHLTPISLLIFSKYRMSLPYVKSSAGLTRMAAAATYTRAQALINTDCS